MERARSLPGVPSLFAPFQPYVEEAEEGAVAKGALLLMGFPTYGLVGSIVAGYLVTALQMRQIGILHCATAVPSVIVEEGRARAPVRIFSSPAVCGPAGKCDQLVVIEADLQPPAFLLLPMAEAILSWAQRREIALAVAVEGFPVDTESRAEPHIAGMANDRGFDTLRFLQVARVTGVSTGFAAALLLAGMSPSVKVPVISVTSQAHPDHPDAIAAAKVIEILHPLFPSLDVDTAPLRATAEELEKSVRQRLAEQSASLDRFNEASQVSMYG